MNSSKINLKLLLKKHSKTYAQLNGAYQTRNKGKSLNFTQVSPYTPGDDIRLINWALTAKYDYPYIKNLEQDHDQAIFLMLDVSSSMQLFTKNNKKNAILEITAQVINLAKINQASLGLILFSNQIHTYLPPKKSQKQQLKILETINSFLPINQPTDFNYCIDNFLKYYKKRALIFLISDFIDQNLEFSLKKLNLKQQIIPIIIEDSIIKPKHEKIIIFNPETNQKQILTNSPKIQHYLETNKQAFITQQKQIFQKLNLNVIFS